MNDRSCVQPVELPVFGRPARPPGATAARIGDVSGLGRDEVLIVRRGTDRRQHVSTRLVDVRRGPLPDVVPGRSRAVAVARLAEEGGELRDRTVWGTLDLPGPYRRVFAATAPTATVIANPFHVAERADTKLDECRRRVRNETFEHGGRKSPRSLEPGGSRSVATNGSTGAGGRRSSKRSAGAITAPPPSLLRSRRAGVGRQKWTTAVSMRDSAFAQGMGALRTRTCTGRAHGGASEWG